MSRILRHAGKYIVLLLMLVCFGHILSIGTEIAGYGTSVIYYLDESPYDLEQVIHMKENDETLENYLPFTACGHLEENQSFANPDIGRELSCPVIYIYGSSAMLCTASGELLPDDLTGCILSSEAAWQLFGETSVIGGEVAYNDRIYYVRGVYENETANIILPAKTLFEDANNAQEETEGDMAPLLGGISDGEAVFDKLIVKPMQEGSVRSEYVQAFENRWGLNDKTDCLIYQRLANFFMMLIPALLFIYILIKALIYIYRNRYRPFWMAVGLAAAAVMFFMFFVICQTSPSIPSDMIPNRWSDFDFWGDLIDTFRTSIQHILFSNKTEIELIYFKPLVSMAGYLLGGVILFTAVVWLFKITSWHHLFLSVAVVCVVELLAVYMLRQADLVMNVKQMLLYLWPYMLIGKFIFCRENS